MIQALDHIALATPSLDAAVADYQLLLGRGTDGASFRLANVRLDLRAADGAGSEGLAGLGFATADLGKTGRLLQQRALSVTRDDGSLRIAAAATHGVPISVAARDPGSDPTQPSPLQGAEQDAAVSGLDHVVIRSPNPERAIALYAGRLGLSLRLDRTEPAWGARLVFFRCGDLVVEVAHDLKAGIGDGPDRLWGLSWRVPDVGKAHARLRAVGVDVSDIRAGRRPNTRVFTVKSHTAGVPTLMLGADARQEASAA
jgi:catechol 2,3-dioxygenase-like lactoylglutathione lyase family enzyme